MRQPRKDLKFASDSAQQHACDVLSFHDALLGPTNQALAQKLNVVYDPGWLGGAAQLIGGGTVKFKAIAVGHFGHVPESSIGRIAFGRPPASDVRVIGASEWDFGLVEYVGRDMALCQGDVTIAANVKGDLHTEPPYHDQAHTYVLLPVAMMDLASASLADQQDRFGLGDIYVCRIL